MYTHFKSVSCEFDHLNDRYSYLLAAAVGLFSATDGYTASFRENRKILVLGFSVSQL